MIAYLNISFCNWNFLNCFRCICYDKDCSCRFKDDENCSRLISESLDPDGQVSPAQVINKLKQLGLKVALKKRKRSVGRPFSTNPDRLGENGEIIEKESNLRNSIDLEGSLPRL